MQVETYKIRNSSKSTAYSVMAIAWNKDPIMKQAGFYNGPNYLFIICAGAEEIYCDYDVYRLGRNLDMWVVEDLQKIKADMQTKLNSNVQN
jgi:hypothetical protein